jgi:uncharacterized repeat protein (TIGR03803 family)
VLFNVKPPAHACAATICPWTDITLHSFGFGSDGASPIGNVVFDSQGNLYGTTYSGGTYGSGTVYKATLSGGTWTVSVIYSFPAYPNDGADPFSAVVLDSAGNLYGTTEFGGSGDCSIGCGTVFELSPSQGGWTETILHSFADEGDGCYPGPLVFGQAGNLYGVTTICATVFELSPQQGGGWNFTTIYTLTGGRAVSLAIDAAGNLYSANLYGGYGYGNVFELSPSGGGWMYTDLYDFTGGNDGLYPEGVAVTSPGGYLYGNTVEGGADGDGVDYQINLGARH